MINISPQSQRLDGQRALITGATSGLDRAIAQRLAQEGAEVLVHGRDPDRGAETVASIVAGGGTARFVAADLGSHSDVLRLAQEVGDIDILVNNAGFVVFAPTTKVPVEAFDATFAINVRAPFYLVAAFAPGMAQRGRGSIISVDSMAGRIGLVGAAAYGASKAALSAMTRAWTAEYSPSGVRINAIAPGADLHGRSVARSHPSARRVDASSSGGTASGNRRSRGLSRLAGGELHRGRDDRR